ncbi:transposase [Nodosilinea sp. P-1105]|nr:transposase [Nodosilinea sp. P-1105]
MVLAFMRLPPTPNPAVIDSRSESAVERIEILEAFVDLPDVRRAAGKRHHMALCLALFNPPKDRLPSYSTIRRVLLKLDYGQYSAALDRSFGIEPLPGETLAVDGKVLRGSYQLETDNSDSSPHPAIILVSAYLVERGLILEPYQVDGKTNEIKAFAQRIRGYWGVENKVHHVRDATQGEDASRIRMHQLPQIFAVVRNFALNLYRSNAFSNMAQAERLCKFGLDTLKTIFRMK